MSKRSRLRKPLTESCGWWEHGRKSLAEWTYEGGRKRKQVVTDGDPYPLPDGTYVSTYEKDMEIISSRVAPQDLQLLSQHIYMLGQGFFCFWRRLL